MDRLRRVGLEILAVGMSLCGYGASTMPGDEDEVAEAQTTYCFHCHGTGSVIGRPNYGYDDTHGGCRTGPHRTYKCATCGGSGRVSWEQLEGWRHGNFVRGWRAAKNMSLLTMAEKVGIGSAELSSYETGRVPWPDDVREQVRTVMYPAPGVGE
ncbi:MAG: hypothetical protein AAF479_07705 [Pseudomonadota bacterium]